jgi:hypothetical protein
MKKTGFLMCGKHFQEEEPVTAKFLRWLTCYSMSGSEACVAGMELVEGQQ